MALLILAESCLASSVHSTLASCLSSEFSDFTIFENSVMNFLTKLIFPTKYFISFFLSEG